jgi:hypothetical protein
VLCIACSSSSSTTTTRYQIAFPSTGAAIAADTLEIQIFDHTGGRDCVALVGARRVPAEAATLTPLQSQSVGVCALLQQSPAGLTVPYGDFAVLVVAKQGAKDFLIGCLDEQVGASSATPPTVALTLFDTSIVVAPSVCPTIAAHCGDVAQCNEQDAGP